MRCNVERNRREHSPDRKYKSVEQLIREAYGCNPAQMEKWMEWAETEASSSSPLGGRNIPQAPENEFQTILEKMETRNITPRVMADFTKEEQELLQSEKGFLAAQASWFAATPLPEEKAEKSRRQKSRKGKRRKGSPLSDLLLTTGIAAACMAGGVLVFMLRPGIDVMAKRSYTYISREREDGKTDIVWNNQENYISDEGKLREAYEEIQEALRINVIRLNYLPSGMYLSGFSIDGSSARLDFANKKDYMYMIQVICSKDACENRFSDGKQYTTVFNEWLDLKIPVQRVQRSDGRYEYSAYLERDNAYYYIQAVLEEEEFINVIQNMSY